MGPKTTTALTLLPALAALLPALAAAQAGPLDAAHRSWLQLNVTRATYTSSTIGDAFDAGTSSSIDQERDLALAARRPYGGLLMGRRIGERFRIEAELTRAQRSGVVVLPADITLDGITWSGGTSLRTDFAFRTTRVSGGFSALRLPEAEFGVAFGGQVVGVRRAFEGTGTGGARYTVESDSTLQPLLGLYASVEVARVLRLAGRVDSAVDDDDFLQVDLSATFRPVPNIGIGVGWRFVDARFANETFFFGYDDPGLLRYRARGPKLLFEASF